MKRILIFAGVMIVLFFVVRFADTYDSEASRQKKIIERDSIIARNLQLTKAYEQHIKDSIQAVTQRKQKEISDLKEEISSIGLRLSGLSSVIWSNTSFNSNGTVNLSIRIDNSTHSYRFTITSVKITPTETGIHVVCASGECISYSIDSQVSTISKRIKVAPYDESFSDLLKKYQSKVRELLNK